MPTDSNNNAPNRFTKMLVRANSSTNSRLPNRAAASFNPATQFVQNMIYAIEEEVAVRTKNVKFHNRQTVLYNIHGEFFQKLIENMKTYALLFSQIKAEYDGFVCCLVGRRNELSRETEYHYLHETYQEKLDLVQAEIKQKTKQSLEDRKLCLQELLRVCEEAAQTHDIHIQVLKNHLVHTRARTEDEIQTKRKLLIPEFNKPALISAETESERRKIRLKAKEKHDSLIEQHQEVFNLINRSNGIETKAQEELHLEKQRMFYETETANLKIRFINNRIRTLRDLVDIQMRDIDRMSGLKKMMSRVDMDQATLEKAPKKLPLKHIEIPLPHLDEKSEQVIAEKEKTAPKKKNKKDSLLFSKTTAASSYLGMQGQKISFPILEVFQSQRMYPTWLPTYGPLADDYQTTKPQPPFYLFNTKDQHVVNRFLPNHECVRFMEQIMLPRIQRGFEGRHSHPYTVQDNIASYLSQNFPIFASECKNEWIISMLWSMSRCENINCSLFAYLIKDQIDEEIFHDEIAACGGFVSASQAYKTITRTPDATTLSDGIKARLIAHNMLYQQRVYAVEKIIVAARKLIKMENEGDTGEDVEDEAVKKNSPRHSINGGQTASFHRWQGHAKHGIVHQNEIVSEQLITQAIIQAKMQWDKAKLQKACALKVSHFEGGDFGALPQGEEFGFKLTKALTHGLPATIDFLFRPFNNSPRNIQKSGGRRALLGEIEVRLLWCSILHCTVWPEKAVWEQFLFETPTLLMFFPKRIRKEIEGSMLPEKSESQHHPHHKSGRSSTTHKRNSVTKTPRGA